MHIFAIYLGGIAIVYDIILWYYKHSLNRYAKRRNIVKKDYMLSGKTAQKLYAAVKDLPIIDYHCHLSPKEIFEDKPFDNIGEIWLGGDHYKWRLMRTAGIDERYITGDATWHEKFVNFAKAVEFAAGHPLYHWSHMELSNYFGIDIPLTEETADEIWQRANEHIKNTGMSPRKLISDSNVEIICTTDDVVDSLEWHEKIRNDASITARVLPSFRNDNLLLMRREGYLDYVKKLSQVSGVEITDLASLKKAIELRLDFFVKMGCKYTDVGIAFFPDKIASENEAEATWNKVLGGEVISDDEYMALIGYLYVFFGKLYKERNLVMQWHLGVIRNSNTTLFKKLGGDCGVDVVGDPVKGADLCAMLDAINENSGLPQTVLYTLNEDGAAQMACIAAAFPGVRAGAAWWFCDHKRGIEDEINIISESSCLGSFLGMLTDSRSFLSYARHEYFRRILCNLVGEWVEKGEYNAASAEKLVAKISYLNVKELTNS